MNSSGIKRGLAATAISALAITGVPLLSGTAYADSINAQTGAGNVELFTQYSGVASTQNDGQNQTVHLLAGGGTGVSQVRFEYTPAAGGAAVTIATVSRTNGAFSTEWAPPVATFGTTVTVSAVGLDSTGNELNTDQQATQVNQNASAVDIANAPGSALGVFDQPYGTETQETGALPGAGIDHNRTRGIVTGTTSGAGAVQLRDLSAGSTPLEAAATPGDATNGVRSFRGLVNFQNYDLTGTPDEAVIGADQTGGSDDAEVVNLQGQTITTVTAVAQPATVNQGSTSSAVITVTDAQGRPISGAQVIKDTNRDGLWDGDGADDTVGTADDETSSYTGALGQSTFAGLAGSAAGSSYDFFVNVDDDDDYQANKDFRRTVTVTSQAQTTTSLTATSADGAAFDTQEYAQGDIAVQVNDQNGTAVPDGRNVSYTWTFTPAPTTATPNPAAVTTTGTATTAGGNGRAVVNAPANGFAGDGTYVLSAFVDSNGTPGQQAGELSATPLTLKAGDSTLAFTEAPTATSVSGTTDTYEATLRLFDGTALTGRLVNFTYTPTGNSVVAAQANQPSGTTRGGNTTASDTTDANGAVSVAISDPATPNQPELGNTLSAATGTNAIGNAAENTTGNDLNVDFVTTNPVANTAIVIQTPDTGKPGEPVSGTASVTIDDTDPATPANPQPAPAGTAVTLTVSGSAFFTDGQPATGGTTGQDARLDNDGQTKTFVTGATGQVTFQTSIGRDTGFDDDGLVTATVSSASGTVSTTSDTAQVFDSSDPINGGEVQLVQSPDSEQNNPTDPTQTGEEVYYDVYTTDQFGNRVGGEPVTLTASNDAFLSSNGVASDFDDDGDFFVTADDAGTVTLTATWTTGTTVYTSPTTAGLGPDETLTDTATEEFYDVDLAASTYTITSNPEGNVPVGTAVTETVTVVDQEGNPISDLTVRFIRSGPGDQDGDANVVTSTNNNGQAFYSFAGTTQGTAQISAVVSGPGNEPLQTLTDSVVFVGQTTPTPEPGTPPANVTARVSGPNNGATQDRIVVSTTTDQAGVRANGAEVRIYKIVNGRKQQLGGKKRLSDAGRAVFNRRDKNGNGVTRYTATVRFTSDTRGANSNTVGLR